MQHISQVSTVKKNVTILLQAVVVLIGICALGLLLWEPHIEGRNAYATTFEIYFNDPFLAYAYVASLPFFTALYQAFKVLGYVRQNKLLSQATLQALRTIKYCAVAIVGFAVGGEIFIIFSTSDDRAGGVFIGALIIVGSIISAVVAAVCERHLRRAIPA